MSVDGLWTAEFGTSQGFGTGVVVFFGGRILGGDTNYYYDGTYSVSGSRVVGNLSVMHYAGPLTNVFGPLRSLRLSFEGAVGENLIMGHGYEPSIRQQRLSVRLKRVVELSGTR